MMTTRAGRRIATGIVLMGLAVSCSRPALPPATKSSGPVDTSPSGLVRPGHTGEYVSFELGRPLRPGEPLPPAVFPQMFLNDFGSSRWGRGVFHHTPIVVTKNPADEEFWESTFLQPEVATGSVAKDGDGVWLVLGARQQCEALRVDYERNNNVRTGPCAGPHYFKRTGPPVLRPPRGGYNVEPLWEQPPEPPRR